MNTTELKNQYRKKPVEIQAIQWVTDNYADCEGFCPNLLALSNGSDLLIPTLEGNMKCRPFDWIIRGIKGEFYPCKPDIFADTYEPVESHPAPPNAEDAESLLKLLLADYESDWMPDEVAAYLGPHLESYASHTSARAVEAERQRLADHLNEADAGIREEYNAAVTSLAAMHYRQMLVGMKKAYKEFHSWLAGEGENA